MKTNKTQNKRKKSNRDETRKNKDIGKKSMTSTSESTAPRSLKSRIAKILNAIFPGKNKGKNKNKSTSNSVTNNSSPNKTISTLSLQLNAIKLAQDNNINTIEDNNTNAPLTFSTFGKESKNSNQHIVKDNARRSPSPPPPIRASSLRKSSSTPALQTNSTKLDQGDNTSASLTFSTFGKESKNSNQHIVKDNARRSPSPPPPIRASSLRKSSSTPTLQTNSTKLDQGDNTSASLTFSTFGKESKNSNQHIVKDNAHRSPSPPPPIRASSLRKSSSTPTLQTNSTKLDQGDNTSASLTFSTFGKENKNSNQHIVKDDGHFLPPPPPSQTLKRSNLQDKRKKGKERNMGR